jgi:type I restriction enzyme S subunit
MVEAMKIQEGFKQTEVGVIPSDWDYDEIQYLAGITTGAKNTQDRVSDGAYPFFVRSQTVERINSYSYDGVAVLTAGDGVGTGKVFHYIDGKFDFHQRVYKISEFTERLDGYFFYLYFSKNFYNRIMQMTAKSSVDSVRREMIAKMLIPLPSKAEQTAIATALNDADALIAQLEKLIAKKRAIKQGAMQELLKPKDGWEFKKLGELAEINMGQSPDSKHYNLSGDGLPLIQGNADIKNRKSIKRVWTKQITKTCKVDDLIMTVRAPVGTVGIASENSCIGRGVCSFKVMSVNKSFLFHLLIFKETDWKILEQGSTFTSANSYQIFGFELAIPKDKKKQTRIAKILSDMDTEIEAIEKKLKKYKMLKQGMMQNLLTGKIRLV